MPELTVLRESVKAIRSKNGGAVLALDIGGNVGHHTTFLAGIADQVITFEPYPPLQQQIGSKIALNKFENVKLMPFGLGEKDEVLDYYPGMGENSGVGSFLHADDPGKATPVKLQIKRGDSVLEELGVGKVDIMKVDVEGFEAAVFRGLQDRIHRDRPVILTELTDGSRRQFGSEKEFREAFYPGAHFFEVSGRPGHSYKLEPFQYDTAYEILVTAPEMGWLRDALLRSTS
jgi:FkbM family methyltransferase